MITPSASGTSAKQGQLLSPAAAASPHGTMLMAPPVGWDDEWEGPVVATALAISALVLAEQHGSGLEESTSCDFAYQGDLSELLVSSLHWLAKRQSPDGGWSAGSQGPSQLATTMLVRATFQLTGMPVAYPHLAEQMQQAIQQRGGLAGLSQQYGASSAANLLVRGTYALSDLLEWKMVPTIPLENATPRENAGPIDPAGAVPRSPAANLWSGCGDALPAVLAMGITSHWHHKPLNPITNWWRTRAVQQKLEWLTAQQGDDGGFADCVATTGSVVMSLSSIKLTSSPIVRRAVEFLFTKLTPQGRWPGKERPPATVGSSNAG